MNRSITMSVVSALLLSLAVGCSSGPNFKEASAKFPQLAPSQGRIFFYRAGSMFGAGIQPDINLNNEHVGNSNPGLFFYVDRPAGNYVVSCSTEAEHKLTFTLTPQETKYVRTSVTMGLFVGQVFPTLEDKDTAMQTLGDCSCAQR